jgi:hypothetical protein
MLRWVEGDRLSHSTAFQYVTSGAYIRVWHEIGSPRNMTVFVKNKCGTITFDRDPINQTDRQSNQSRFERCNLNLTFVISRVRLLAFDVESFDDIPSQSSFSW